MNRKLLALPLILLCGMAKGSDAYFVRFSVDGRQIPSGGNVRWGDEIIFYNANAGPVVIRFLGVSNGTSQIDAPTLTLPPRQPVFLNFTLAADKWLPLTHPTLWVLHLDVPDGVVVESRNQYAIGAGVSDIPGLNPVFLGKVSMPIFRGLVPAGQPQTHVGTDLGESDSRVNVGVYNAGTDVATATIEVRRTCDSAVVDSRAVTIPANTLTQVGGLMVGSSDCPSTAAEPWTRYTVVTVTQPSFTFVSNLNENIPLSPAFIGSVPIVGLAVAKNERF